MPDDVPVVAVVCLVPVPRFVPVNGWDCGCYGVVRHVVCPVPDAVVHLGLSWYRPSRGPARPVLPLVVAPFCKTAGSLLCCAAASTPCCVLDRMVTNQRRRLTGTFSFGTTHAHHTLT
jgi:hypothetical protein